MSPEPEASWPWEPASTRAPYGATWVPVASVTLSASATSSAPLAELPAQRDGLRHHVDADREHGQRARLARELDPARGDRKAGLVVPDHHGRGCREPPPAEDLLDGDIVGPRRRWRPARAPALPRSGPP